MRKAHLITVLVGLAAVAVLSADASAMYNPKTGRFLQRDPGTSSAMRVGAAAGQYADGASLYLYVRSAPVTRTDPHGLLSSDNTFDCHGVATLRVKTDCCSAQEVAQIETVVRSAYMTLQNAKDAMWPLKEQWPDMTQHGRAYQRFLNFFNQGKPFIRSDHLFWYDTAEEVAQYKLRLILGVFWRIIDRMDDRAGMLFVCEQGQQGYVQLCTGGENAWRAGDKIHVCGLFYNRQQAANTQTVLHELSHLFAGTNDYNDWNRVYAGGRGDTYIPGRTTGNAPAQIPGVPAYDNGLPDNPFEHADTVAEFAMAWYFASY